MHTLTLSSEIDTIETFLGRSNFVTVPGTPEWKVGAIMITPETAQNLLNSYSYPKNRNIRPRVVTKYKNIMKAGEWVLSPEGLVFSDKNELLQGQHRLSGIVKSGIGQELFITLNVHESIFKVLDRGAIRSISDATGITKELASVARLMCTLALGNNTIPDYQLINMAMFIRPYCDELMAHCSSTSKGICNAYVRLAACIRIMEGNDVDYVLDTYRSLMLRDYTKLPPIANALVRQVDNGTSAGEYDLMVRAYYILDKSNSDVKRLQISDVRRDEIMGYFRKVSSDILANE